MSLIKIEEYNGSEIGNAAIEALTQIGVISKLNSYGYHLAIEGIQKPTPKGMIDDTPSSHKIQIERNKFIEKCFSKPKDKIKLIEGSDSYVKYMENPKSNRSLMMCMPFNIDFQIKDGYEITHEISKDAESNLWYKHSVEFYINQLAVEPVEGYLKRLFEEVANYVIDAFELMNKEGDN